MTPIHLSLLVWNLVPVVHNIHLRNFNLHLYAWDILLEVSTLQSRLRLLPDAWLHVIVSFLSSASKIHYAVRIRSHGFYQMLTGFGSPHSAFLVEETTYWKYLLLSIKEICQAFCEELPVWIWDSEDRASSYILIIKPTRCTNFQIYF
jgi:hypothetical protein